MTLVSGEVLDPQLGGEDGFEDVVVFALELEVLVS